MEELLSKIPAREVVPIFLGGLGIIFGCMVAVTAIIAKTWRNLREREMTTSVVHGMLDAGFSTNEIERVLKASGKNHVGTINIVNSDISHPDLVDAVS